MNKILKAESNEKEIMQFVNHFGNGLNFKIVETDDAFYALYPWESFDGKVLQEDKDSWEKTQAEIEKANKKDELLEKITNLELKSQRSLRAIVLNNYTAEDQETLKTVEDEIKKLRDELNSL